MIVLTLGRSWLGRENPGLTGELLAELPGILAWALDGLERLTRTGRFTEPSSSADAVLSLQDLASPVAAFVRDTCEVGPVLEVAIPDLFNAWKQWCEDSGHNRSGSVQTFGRNLKAVVPGVKHVDHATVKAANDAMSASESPLETTMRWTADHRGPQPQNPP